MCQMFLKSYSSDILSVTFVDENNLAGIRISLIHICSLCVVIVKISI